MSEEIIKEEVVSDDKEVVAEKKKQKIDVKNIILLFIDFIAINVAYICSLMLLSSVSMEMTDLTYLHYVVLVTPYYAIGVLILFYVCKLYILDYSKMSIVQMRRLIICSFFASLIYMIIMRVLDAGFAYAFFVLGGLLQYIFTALARFFFRLTHFKFDNRTAMTEN